MYMEDKVIYTGFSGAELVVAMDGNIVKGLQAISYDASLRPSVTNQRPVSVKCVFAILESEPTRYLLDKEFDIILQFINEYGNKVYKKILGARLVSESMEASIDNIVINLVYTFAAREVTMFEQGIAEELQKWI